MDQVTHSRSTDTGKTDIHPYRTEKGIIMAPSTEATILNVAALAIAALLTLIIVGAIVSATLPGILPPCVTEDATWCFWDASTSGNGTGLSFIDLGGLTIHLGANRG